MYYSLLLDAASDVVNNIGAKNEVASWQQKKNDKQFHFKAALNSDTHTCGSLT